ncbi:helix-turn-helix domain-containing protein [Gorillibacterium sp. sgz500922]|uniref:helix-turn-helix domain-containing protein n=1 Tax=Gorillibacterium sp. sgz500922 TaxID=3446694 RepID=UPI003F670C64
MGSDSVHETFGFRYTPADHLALCNLYAVGHDVVCDPSYRWDSSLRTDGPQMIFQYTLAGEGVLETAGETYRIGPGRAIMVEVPGDFVYSFPQDGESWTFLFIQILPALIAPNWHEAKRRLGPAPFLPETSKPIRMLQAIFDEACAGRIADAYTASSMVYQFVTELCRFASLPPDDRREWPVKVRQVAEHLEAHYDQMLSLDQLAELHQVSKYHLIRMFTAAVGVPPGEYRSRIRIEQAMRLLRQTDESLDQIAERVGYSSGSYFIRAFRQMTGCTPGSFRSGQEHMTIHRLLFN